MRSTGTTIYDHTIEQLKLAGEGHSPKAMIALLADTVIVRSPITDRIRFEGIEQAADLFERVFDSISDIRFYEVVGAGTPTQVIFWRGTVAGRPLEEANLLRLDDQGRITEMTVFMRAIPGLLHLLAELAPSLASRRSRIRAALIRTPLRLLALIYRTVEPLVLRIARVGVAVPDRCDDLDRAQQ